MKLRLLGTGVPVPSLKRKSSGYLLRTGDDVILFDHGQVAKPCRFSSLHINFRVAFISRLTCTRTSRTSPS